MRKGLLLAGLVAAIGLSVSEPARAGGWYDYQPVYPPNHFYVYNMYPPAPRFVHMVAYESPGYYGYYGRPPYAYGVYWAPPYYRSYYPVRTVYPVRRLIRR